MVWWRATFRWLLGDLHDTGVSMTSSKRSNPKMLSRKKYSIVIVIALIVWLGSWLLYKALPFGPQSALARNEMKDFVLEPDGIGFSYPDHWIGQLTPQGDHGDQEVIAILLDPAKVLLNLFIARHQFSNQDITEVAAWGKSRVQVRFSRYESNASTPYESGPLSGQMAEYIAWTGSPIETENIHCKDLYFLRQGYGYAFSFCTKERDWSQMSPVFDKIVSTIGFQEQK
jgi:hypothetical protein